MRIRNFRIQLGPWGALIAPSETLLFRRLVGVSGGRFKIPESTGAVGLILLDLDHWQTIKARHIMACDAETSALVVWPTFGSFLCVKIPDGHTYLRVRVPYKLGIFGYPWIFGLLVQ